MIRKPKGPTARARAAKRRRQLAKETKIKNKVRVLDGPVCRCCLQRAAESVHEIKPKGMGGNPHAVSLENSVHVCGSGTTGCHGHLQAHCIKVTAYRRPDDPINAREGLTFTPMTGCVADWMGVAFGGSISSQPQGERDEFRSEAV